MKCIRCGHDSKFKDRTNRRCPACHGEFAFEPQEKDIVTDVAFENAIQAVSSKGQVHWGIENLYYEICRRKRPRSHAVAFLVVAAAVGVVGTFAGWLLAQILAAGFVFLAWLSWQSSRRMTVSVDSGAFGNLWQRWRRVHGDPERAIARKEQADAPRASEPDVGDYSFDRAVICDRARTVDLLIANNFHFENNCAVLAVDGYPPGPFETVRTMLKRNPKLRVLVLHDATPTGCRLASKLTADAAWFKDQVPVVDVGLRPSHAKPFRGLLLAATTGVVVEGDGVSATEAKWLTEYALELAAIRPEQLLKRLYKAMNRSDDSGDSGMSGDGGGSGGWVMYDNDSFSADASASDGGADSFG